MLRMQPKSSSLEASFNPQDPSPQFSFAGTPRGYSKSDLEEEIQSLARWKSAPEWALKALRRGIGIHHSGMNKHYRTLVESLYRAGYLRVVICTGTLALGINAPTRTSVFVGIRHFSRPYVPSMFWSRDVVDLTCLVKSSLWPSHGQMPKIGPI
ncbi:hypothetical protein A0H81_12107 [Grifola frondosa]|uniref:Helicase C-terminal domain-containing protein n=1 Tax=Grifola frondosa TaxID=5627 RepID=A0A1C7LYC9_GRIFR|nr:hypothetical protein A0H81_12107 [Grifola frondosa]